MQIFQGTQQELKERFNLSPMVIVWIGLLRNKNYVVTEPFLEMCEPNAPLEPLIKDRTLMSVLEKPVEFETLQAKYDPERNFPLVILDQGTYKVLALEAEVLSEAGWKKETQELGLQKIENNALDVPISGLENLFPSQEMARLKMVLATAVRSEDKIESIRKINLSPLSLQEKSLLFLHAMNDSDRLVRIEAIQALGNLGLSNEITHIMEVLNQQDIVQQKYALNSLSTLFESANDMERGAILQILLAILSDEKYKACAGEIFRTFAKVVSILPAGNEAILEKIMGSVVVILLEELNSRREDAELLFKSIGEKNATLLHSFLWKEIEKTTKSQLRAFFLLMLIETKAEITEKLLDKVVFEIGLGDELDIIYARLNYALVQQGEKSIPALLKRFEQSIRVTERISIIHLFDKIHEEHPLHSDWLTQILKIFIKIFPSATEELRFNMMDSLVVFDPKIPATVKTAFAEETLIEVHKPRLDQYASAVKSLLCRIKEPSIPALLRFLKNPLHPAQAVHCGEILADVISCLPKEDTEEFQKVYEFCNKNINNGFDCSGRLFLVLGKMTHSPVCTEEINEEIGDYLLLHLCKTTYPFIILEGLGWSASSETASWEHRSEVVQLFQTLMDRKLPTNLSQEEHNVQGTIFAFDAKTTAYTDLLPSLLQGFQRIGLQNVTPSSLRNIIIHYLLKKWENITHGRLIWSPKNTTDLAEVLSNLCCCNNASNQDKVEIASALFEKIDIFFVAELLCKLLANVAIPEIVDIAEKTANKLLEFIQSDDYKSPEDREVILHCAGILMHAPKLASGKKNSDNLREKLLYALYEGFRDQICGIYNILKQLLDVSFLTKKQKLEIERRISYER